MKDSYIYLDLPRTEMVPFVPADARHILDVGCGVGGFGKELKRLRPDVRVTGIEASASALEIASQRYDHVILGQFPDDFPSGSFDCIVFNDVLEHLVDPWAALDASRAALASGGCIVASIPNLRYFMVLYRLVIHRDFTYVSDGVLDRTHVRFFTQRTAQEMFEGAGFSIDCARGINEIHRSELPASCRRILRTFELLRPGLHGICVRNSTPLLRDRLDNLEMVDRRVSVIMPVRNAELHIEQAVESLLSQQFGAFEIIVVDDGSTDNSLQILRSIRDERLRIIALPTATGDLARTLNIALDVAVGCYVARMDGDDVSYPSRFSAQVDVLDKCPAVGLVGCWADLIDEGGSYIGTSRPPTGPGGVAYRLHYASPFHHPAVMYRRSLVKAVGGYREGKAFAEDYDLWSRLFSRCLMTNVDQILFAHRVHTTSVSALYPKGQDRVANEVGQVMFEQSVGRVPSVEALQCLRTGIADRSTIVEASALLAELRSALHRTLPRELRRDISLTALQALLHLDATSTRPGLAPLRHAFRISPSRTTLYAIRRALRAGEA